MHFLWSRLCLISQTVASRYRTMQVRGSTFARPLHVGREMTNKLESEAQFTLIHLIYKILSLRTCY
jgi:hypothetical protein